MPIFVEILEEDSPTFGYFCCGKGFITHAGFLRHSFKDHFFVLFVFYQLSNHFHLLFSSLYFFVIQ